MTTTRRLRALALGALLLLLAIALTATATAAATPAAPSATPAVARIMTLAPASLTALALTPAAPTRTAIARTVAPETATAAAKTATAFAPASRATSPTSADASAAAGTATSAQTGTPAHIIEPLLPPASPAPPTVTAHPGQGALLTTGTSTMANATTLTASASARPAMTAIATGSATGRAIASPTALAALTPTPKDAGLALLGPPISVAASPDDLANGASPAIAQMAIRHLGETTRPDGGPWAGWCEMFVSNIAAEAGVSHTRFVNALSDLYAAPLFLGRAPAGSLVFFDQRASIDGHVGIALGDGTMISALSAGIVRTPYEQWPSYIGWRPYPGKGTAYAGYVARLASITETIRDVIPAVFTLATTPVDDVRDVRDPPGEPLPPGPLP